MTEHPTPYVRRHLASHAAAGGVLDEILDADKLPYLDAVRLAELLRLTQAPPHSRLWVLLGAWRSIRHRWNWDDPGANTAALDVALLASGMPPTGRRDAGPMWSPRWAEWMTGGTVVGSAEGRKPRSVFGTVAGRPVLAAGRSSKVWLWDAATGQLLGEPFQAPDLLEGVAMGGDEGSFLVTIDGTGRVTVWDTATRVMTRQFTLRDGGFRGVTTGRLGGRWVIAAGGSAGKVYTRWMDSGKAALKPFGTSKMVRALSLAETEEGTLAAVGHSDGTVALWSLDSGELIGVPIDLRSEVNAVALRSFEDIGTLLAVGTGTGRASVWELRPTAMLGPLWEHSSEVRAVAMAMVGGRPMLAAGCHDGAVLVAPVGHLTSGTLLPHPAQVTTVEFGDVDGRTMVATTCEDGNTRLWDPVQPSGVRVQVDGRVGQVTIVERSEGGIDVLTGNDRSKLHWWSGDGGSRLLEVDVKGSRPVRRKKSARDPSAAVAADYLGGRLTALTSYLSNVQLWQLGDDLPGSADLIREHRPEDARPVALYVGRGRALFAVAQWAEPPRVVDAFTGKARRLKRRHTENEKVLGFHAASEQVWLATSSYERVTLDEADYGGPLGPPLPTTWLPSSVALGKLDGGEALAVLARGVVRLWDPRSGDELLRPIETSSSARDLAWAHLGDRDVLLTLHFATVRVWNPHTGRKLTELPFGTSIDTMAVHSSREGVVHVAVGGPGLVFTELREGVAEPLGIA